MVGIEADEAEVGQGSQARGAQVVDMWSCRAVCFMAFDAGHQGLARHYLTHSLRLAKAAENYAPAAHILTDLSMQALHVNHPDAAVASAQAAVEAANKDCSPLILARCHAVAARASAAANDSTTSDRHLVQAELLLDQGGNAEEPRWVSFFSMQVTVEAMYASHALGRTTYVQRHADAARLVSSGPREVDLVPTWHAARRYGRDKVWKNAFATEYGYNLAGSPAYEALMHMRDMMQLTGPLRRSKADQRYLTFLRQRLSGIRAGNRSSQWLTV